MQRHRLHNNRAGGATLKKNIVVLVVAIILAPDKRLGGHAGSIFSVGAFQPAPRSRATMITTENSRFNDSKTVVSNPSLPSPNSNTSLRFGRGNKNDPKNKNDEDKDTSPIFWKDLSAKPGNLIVLPFVAIVGIDLLLNIFFITKRSFDFFVLGQAPSTEPW
eukprot:CAMPEP_0201131016 /NCGR_PEP_ID=MMETSP0850-20130426/41582_1 /ASSEMBLY_ACC=CAM_ASM_000622 /TAXON_ID=183588 /ORGANISM="Pseudo-nitzschia fraudulenta, Strain WWA7" /LENGTH=161 /DNA_ID=CAMNT_0047400943 /DNA_START=61 /DNA_END=543 /DNA_ORIENTATION=-